MLAISGRVSARVAPKPGICNAGAGPGGVTPYWMNRSMFSANTTGSSLNNPRAMGASCDTTPACEPGFGTLPTPALPWHFAQSRANRTAPCLGSPIILTTVTDAACASAAGGVELGLVLAVLPFSCAGVDDEAEAFFSVFDSVPAPAAAGLDEGFRMKSAKLLSCGWVRFLCAGMMVVGTCMRGSVICVISHWLERPNFASWDKSGPATPPLPSILWQATQPTETKNTRSRWAPSPF